VLIFDVEGTFTHLFSLVGIFNHLSSLLEGKVLILKAFLFDIESLIVRRVLVVDLVGLGKRPYGRP